jgi:hypothetical protein
MVGVWIRSCLVRNAPQFRDRLLDGSQRDGKEGVVGHALEPSYLYLEGTLTFNEWNVFRRASFSVCGQTICLTFLSESVGSFWYSLMAYS